MSEASIISDANKFMLAIKDLPYQPLVSFGDGEILFEWIDLIRHAIVSIEGDGTIGYAMECNGTFAPGAINDAPVDQLPADLAEYLKDLHRDDIL